MAGAVALYLCSEKYLAEQLCGFFLADAFFEQDVILEHHAELVPQPIMQPHPTALTAMTTAVR